MPGTSLPSEIKAQNRRLDIACHRVGLGGLFVWRLIKRLSQLAIITFGFWAGFTGVMDPRVAYGGMIIVYLGVEGVETVLESIGEDGVNVSVTTGEQSRERATRRSEDE